MIEILIFSGVLFGTIFIAKTLGLVISLAITLIWLWLLSRILRRAGFSGWWCLLGLSSTATVIGTWAFAFIDWPARPLDGVIPPYRRS